MGVSVVGFLPYALYVDRLQVPTIAGAALAALIVSSLQVRGFTTLASEKPTLGEYLLGWLSGITLTSTASFLALLAFWAAYGLIRLVELLGYWFGQTWSLAPGSWAFWVSFPVFVLLGIGFLIGVANVLPKQLYPNSAGAHSPFYQLLVERKRLIRILSLALGTLIIIAWLFPPPGKAFAISLLILLLYTGALVSGRRRTRGSQDKQRILDALRRLLTASGYETIMSPRTGRSEVDPLFANVDIFAHSPGRAWVIEVKVGPPKKEPVSWHDASSLQTAAEALGLVFREQGLSTAVVPCLILVGHPRAESLERYLQEQPLKVIDLEPDGWIDIMAGMKLDHPELFRILAADRLSIEPVSAQEFHATSTAIEGSTDV